MQQSNFSSHVSVNFKGLNSQLDRIEVLMVEREDMIKGRQFKVLELLLGSHFGVTSLYSFMVCLPVYERREKIGSCYLGSDSQPFSRVGSEQVSDVTGLLKGQTNAHGGAVLKQMLILPSELGLFTSYWLQAVWQTYGAL